jgi:hypothetical protein
MARVVNKTTGIYGTKRSGGNAALQMYGSCKPESPWRRHVFAFCVNGWTAWDFLSLT